jgi:glucans biosynthesis protein C
MASTSTSSHPDPDPTVVAATPAGGVPRDCSIDTLKLLLVVGVIVGHATMAWTDNDEAWVLSEPPIREPLLSVVNLMALVGVLFAMSTFFLIAGSFTPRSLERKGLRRFVIDRTLRFGLPLLFYLLFLAPIVEYVDAREQGDWHKSFAAFLPHIWRRPAPGPLWFLEVLLAFSIGYAVIRTIVPPRDGAHRLHPLRVRHLVVAVCVTAVALYLVRLRVSFDEEIGQDLFLGQSPVWLTGFAFGIVGAEHGWFERISPQMSRLLFGVAWSAVGGVVVVVATDVGAMGADIEEFYGGAKWQAAALALLQGILVVSMPLWLVDVFRRRLPDQTRFVREMSRAAFGAYIVHQVVLVGTVVATRHVAWSREIEYLMAAALAVVGSFGIGALIVRLPGASRIV